MQSSPVDIRSTTPHSHVATGSRPDSSKATDRNSSGDRSPVTGIGWVVEPGEPSTPDMDYRPDVVRSLYRSLERADLHYVTGSVRVIEVEGAELIEHRARVRESPPRLHRPA